VPQVPAFTDDASCTAFMDRFGVRCTVADFSSHGDKVMAAHQSSDSVDNGQFDYNRLENR